MIIQSIKFIDFGVYGGEQSLDLTLSADSLYDRPIILFHGKNGVGKTSLVEGIRLALHGSLAIGDRISQRAYQEHLKRRIHRPSNPNVSRPTAALITLIFETVREGRTHSYEVTRQWYLVGTGLVEEVEVLENGSPPENVAPENYEPFLRDLIPPSASDLFFFDGEKIDKLTDDEGADAILAGAVQRLLGLHMVQQLEADLDVYISRAAGQIGKQELEALQEELELLKTSQQDLELESKDLGRTIQALKEALLRQEQELADKGGIYAKEYPRLQKKREKLTQEIETVKRRLQDATAGLMPFAAAPKLANKLLDRLDLEAKCQQQKAVEGLLQQRRNELLGKINNPDFWSTIGIQQLDSTQQEKLVDLVTEALTSDATSSDEKPEIFIQASERDRSLMISQLEESLNPVAASFHELAEKLDLLEADLEKTERELKMAPSDIILQPIFNNIQQLNKQLNQRKEEQQKNTEQLAIVIYKLEQNSTKIKQAKEALKQSERVDLAIRAQRAIKVYAEKLRIKKLEALQGEIVRRFNSLCRKGAMLSAASINPDTFTINLERQGEQFKRSMLSAGERQLFALSTLWSLREVAGIPMPVIIDTPLGRLDSDHRLTMLRKFLPEVAHQVILLATDTEIDQTVIGELLPAVSHGYSMTFKPDTGSTYIEPLDFEKLLTTEELKVNLA